MESSSGVFGVLSEGVVSQCGRVIGHQCEWFGDGGVSVDVGGVGVCVCVLCVCGVS